MFGVGAVIAGLPEGTKKLSLFYFELQQGDSKPIRFGNREVVLYLLSGHALINIEGRDFHVQEGCGVHIRSGEDFSLQNRSGCPFVLLQRFVRAAKIFNDRRICYTALMTISPNVSLMPGKTSDRPTVTDNINCLSGQIRTLKKSRSLSV